jgi:hypothetical protein
LLLMEKFDVSYRFRDDEYSSLVAQLVPYERPELPWDEGPGQSPARSLRLICAMSEEAPGLVAWLTVRNHRFASGMYWRSGVFFRHPRYESEALFELVERRRLALTVKAPSPDYFFAILRDSLEELISLRWPGLSYELAVPCPSLLANGDRCTGQFEFTTLQRRRERGTVQIECTKCDAPYDIAWLLTGFTSPALPTDDASAKILHELSEVKADVSRVAAYAADTAGQVRSVLRMLSTEVADCPRLFTLAPGDHERKRGHFWQQDPYLLTLWCEHPGHEHPCPKATYEVVRPKQWLSDVSPYVRLVVKTLHLVVPLAGAAAGLVLSEEQLKALEHSIKFTETLMETLPEPRQSKNDPAFDVNFGSSAEGLGLRTLRTFLMAEDPVQSFGGLRRVPNPWGDFLWICPEHYREYDRGLPVVD